MLLVSVIIGGSIAFAVGTVAYLFWSSIKEWVKSAVKWIKKHGKGVLIGTKVAVEKFVAKLGKICEVFRHYSKKGGQWYVTTETHEVPVNEVPEDIRRKAEAAEKEADITDELELAFEG